MKTFTTPLILIGSIALLSSATTRMNAQDMLAQASITLSSDCNDRTDGRATETQSVTTDFVDAQFEPTPYHGDAFLRSATRLCNGGFTVRVVDANGTVRMTGIYADAHLTLANSLFTYFYDNGALESIGTFRNGTKSGTWERYSINGRRLADREYPGLDVDRLLELNELVAYARTLN